MRVWQEGDVDAKASPIQSAVPVMIAQETTGPRLFFVANDTDPEDYAELCAAGRRKARTLLQRISAEDAPCLLAFAVREMMIADRPWSGVEVGFFHAIAETAIRPISR